MAKSKTNTPSRNKGLSLRGVKFEDAVRAFAKTPKPKPGTLKRRKSLT
jgi:hypothetical protein